MLAYSGSIPGPTLRVREGSQLIVDVQNDGDLEATVHWHGLRLDNRYDGTHETQAPMAVGGSFSYRLEFPDPGIYWYHPHIRQDYGQEMGLYGNIIVVPPDEDYWPPAHREIALTLDDVLIEEGRVGSFDPNRDHLRSDGPIRKHHADAVVKPTSRSRVRRDEIVRFYLTNTANTRVFNVALPNARMKLVGADSGRYEHETWIDSVILAPSERAVVDVLFDQPGRADAPSTAPRTDIPAGHDRGGRGAGGTVTRRPVRGASPQPGVGRGARAIRRVPQRGARQDARASSPRWTWASPKGDVIYTCPMHADVASDEPDHCPKCGMKLLATPVSYVCPMHPDVTSATADKCPKCGMKLLPAHVVAASEGGGHEPGSRPRPRPRP